MAFRFKKATCVVAGTFNMYIVQPAWLAVKDDEKVLDLIQWFMSEAQV